MKKPKHDIKPRVKIILILGRSITPAQCLKWWGRRRLASYINRLRRQDRMSIHTEMVTEKNGDQFARYWHLPVWNELQKSKR